MTYEEKITQRIKDSEKWPSFDRPDFLDELNELAEDSISKDTIEGYLATILIYQQLAEEIIKVYLESHEFFIQLSLFPAEMNFNKRPKAMFGRIIDDLKNTVTLDDEKLKIIELANQLNQIRIDIVHGLTKLSDTTTIKPKVEQAKIKFDSLFKLFDKEYDMFRVTFKDFKKDWDDTHTE